MRNGTSRRSLRPRWLAAGVAAALLACVGWELGWHGEWHARRQELRELERRAQTARAPEPVLYYLGLRLAEAGRHGEAYAAYNQAHALYPASQRCRLARIEALIELKRWDEAERDLAYPTLGAREAAKVGLLRARCLLEGRQEPAKARDLLSRLTQQHPRNAELHYLRGRAHGLLYEPEASLQAFGKAVRLSPAEFRYRRDLAQAHLYFGQLQEAVDHLRVAYEQAPTDPTTLYLLGSSLSMLARDPAQREEARGYLLQVVALRPADPEVHCQLGQIAQNERAFEEAADRFKRCLRLDPSHSDAVYRLAQCRFRLGDEASGNRLMDAYSRLRALEPAESREFAAQGASPTAERWRQIRSIYASTGWEELAETAGNRASSSNRLGISEEAQRVEGNAP